MDLNEVFDRMVVELALDGDGVTRRLPSAGAVRKNIPAWLQANEPSVKVVIRRPRKQEDGSIAVLCRIREPDSDRVERFITVQGG